MSDQGERTCPLCAEEMDLTDQQLKPCKCGYEICVWCWHHIMEMAEKDDTVGRCPACRSPYDKEKIVGMAANFERLVTEVHMEKKMKNQKAKSKLSEGRKQLSSVRVIQRNLVYIAGLPLNLADEDLLQRREYFSQYGKVLKVSMSRTAAGVVQQFPNNTCSVYITYSKEEEAIRCIQNVHGFVLEGRPLRACFGTTKYCHAWLRNMPCSNPDCLYLHEIGTQEDSFTKDETISACTRSRVQQITGVANNTQRHSGNVLPPPLDDCTNISSGIPIVKNASSNSASTVRDSPPNGSSGKPVSLPVAAWGTWATNCHPTAGGILCPNGPSKSKADTISSTQPFSSAVAGIIQDTLHSEVTKRPQSSDGSRVTNELSKPIKQYNSMDSLSSAIEKTLASDISLAPVNFDNQLSSVQLVRHSDKSSCITKDSTNSVDTSAQSSCSEEAIIAPHEEILNLSSELSSVSIHRNAQNENRLSKPRSPPPDYVLVKSPKPKSQVLHYNADKLRDAAIIDEAVKAAASENGICDLKEQSDLILDSRPRLVSCSDELEDDVASFDNQRLKDPEVVCYSYLPKSASFHHVPNNSSTYPLHHGRPCAVLNADSLSADHKVGDDSILHASNILSNGNGYPNNFLSTNSNGLLHGERNEPCSERFVGELVNTDSDAAMDMGESSIISNILSMEFDAWDDSLVSPLNLAKLLGESNDKQNVPLKKSSSLKVQSNNNQSRFSFARQGESKFHAYGAHSSHDVSQQFPISQTHVHDFVDGNLSVNKLGIANGFVANNLDESVNQGSDHFVATSNKLSAFSRAQISAPPGFSVPIRSPPPGFSSHEMMGQAFDSISGNSLFDPSSLMRNSHQTPSTGNIGGAGDIEFMDPAILAVGKGRLQGALNTPALEMRSNYPSQLNYFENEARLQLLMRSLSPQQNLRFSEMGNTFSQLSDSYGISSRLDQSQVSNMASFPQLSMQQSRNAFLSNGQWNGWKEVHSGNSLSVAELLRNERLGFDKFYRGYDDSKYLMPNSGDLYNRTFGI